MFDTRQAGGGSPVQVVDVVEGGGLGEAHPGLPDVLTAVDGLHVLHRLLGGGSTRSDTFILRVFSSCLSYCKLLLSKTTYKYVFVFLSPQVQSLVLGVLNSK